MKCRLPQGPDDWGFSLVGEQIHTTRTRQTIGNQQLSKQQQ